MTSILSVYHHEESCFESSAPYELRHECPEDFGSTTEEQDWINYAARYIERYETRGMHTETWKYVKQTVKMQEYDTDLVEEVIRCHMYTVRRRQIVVGWMLSKMLSEPPILS